MTVVVTDLLKCAVDGKYSKSAREYVRKHGPRLLRDQSDPELILRYDSDTDLGSAAREVYSSSVWISTHKGVIRKTLSEMAKRFPSTDARALYGHICREGLVWDDLEVPFYEDAVAAFHRWLGAGIGVFTFAHGNACEQLQMLRNSTQGDISDLVLWPPLDPFQISPATALAERYRRQHFEFDEESNTVSLKLASFLPDGMRDYNPFVPTHPRAKIQAEAYRRIAGLLRYAGEKPGDLIYLSESEEELAAAREAGWRVIRVNRGKLSKGASRDFEEVENFSEIEDL